MSSANDASENPFFNTVATSTLPTSGSVFGALKYNTNEKLGWLLGGPSASDVYLYSDLAFDNQNGYYDFVADPTKPLFTYQDTTFADQTLVQVVSQFMTFGDDVIQVSTFEPKEYATQFASQDGMFGLTWLPWNFKTVHMMCTVLKTIMVYTVSNTIMETLFMLSATPCEERS
jgi:hypothetical protein